MAEDKTLRLIVGIVLVLFTLPALVMTGFMFSSGSFICPMCGEEMTGHFGMAGMVYGFGAFWLIALLALLVLGIYLIVQGLR